MKDVLETLRRMEKTQGEDYIWRTAKAAADEIERLRGALVDQDTFILKFTNPDRNGDWCCAQCKPYSDMIKDGFICGFHRAEGRLKAVYDAE